VSLTHHSHWGAFLVDRAGEELVIRPHPLDPDPSALLANVAEAPRHRSRVLQPMVRRGWLERGPGPDAGRGREPFVPVAWDRAFDLVSAELQRVRDVHGNSAIYGGSYGWASAGRFHHAQSQVHRFLNLLGGYTGSVNTYSAGAADVILPRVFAGRDQAYTGVTWQDVVDHTELVVAFGGMAAKNGTVAAGGQGRHVAGPSLTRAHARGARFVLISPLADDFSPSLEAEWLPIRPATDTALMLALAHTLVRERLHDRAFLDRCCIGYDQFERYVLGDVDGQPKDAAWAASITQLPAASIEALARRMAAHKTVITVSHSLQRAQYGEQPVWMGLVLAAMLGQIGIQGAGYAYSLGALGHVGATPPAVHIPPFPQGHNPINTYIPVARVTDMLLHPGTTYHYNGRRRTYPDIRLVYWAGGNLFHHHQDLNRLRRALAGMQTLIVHEPFWTASAVHADIVLPTTITLERDDIGGASHDRYVIAMQKALEPAGAALDDYSIFAGLAERLGTGSAFTENRSANDWIRWMYAGLADRLERVGMAAPTFEDFWNSGELELPAEDDPGAWLRLFREDPSRSPLPTPSGKIEITSPTIASFGYADCPAHPMWLAPDEWLGADLARRFPFQLVANQPPGRLHSQLDFGSASHVSKIDGREIVRLNPADAAERGIQDGAVVKVFNMRGTCLAVARLTPSVRRGVAQMATGAWYDPVPLDGERWDVCVSGNPNVLTRDVGTSSLAQGCTGQLCLVDVAVFESDPPPGRGYAPPPTSA
jgi:biotin/methionine sulfoxide reductase